MTTDDEASLLEIFTRMNTMGKGLTKSEVFQALQVAMLLTGNTDAHLKNWALISRPADPGAGAGP